MRLRYGTRSDWAVMLPAAHQCHDVGNRWPGSTEAGSDRVWNARRRVGVSGEGRGTADAWKAEGRKGGEGGQGDGRQVKCAAGRNARARQRDSAAPAPQMGACFLRVPRNVLTNSRENHTTLELFTGLG
eukprot:2687021-Rhodomonas_salina.3